MGCSRLLYSLAVTMVVAATANAASVPVSGLQLWLRADAVNGTSDNGPDGAINALPADGASVSTWKDISGNLRDAAQAGGSSMEPTFQTGAMGGRPVLRFDGNDVLETSATDFGITNDQTYFVVFNTNDNTQRCVVGSVDSANRFGLFLLGSGGVLRYHYGGPTVQSSGFSTGTDYLVEGLRSGTLGSAYRDGTQIGTGTAASATVTNSVFQVGGILDNPGVVPYLDGDLAEVIIYNRALSTTERNQVGSYLQSKYDISGAYVPEPSTLAMLLGLGGIGLLGYLRRRRRS